jgi:hypothetical protein
MRSPHGGEINDGGSGDGNQVIGTFACDGMEMVWAHSPGDGEHAEIWEFFSIRDLGRIGDGIVVSRMTMEISLALGGWFGGR